jgi:hypothetical protein
MIGTIRSAVHSIQISGESCCVCIDSIRHLYCGLPVTFTCCFVSLAIVFTIGCCVRVKSLAESRVFGPAKATKSTKFRIIDFSGSISAPGACFVTKKICALATIRN